MLSFRDPVDEDAGWATAVHNAAYPDLPHDAAFTLWTWNLKDADWVDRSFVVERDGEGVGWVMVDHQVWSINPTRHAGLDPWLHPSLWNPVEMDQVMSRAESMAREMGAEVLRSNVPESQAAVLEILTARGYHQVGVQKFWELDLERHRERVLEMARSSRLEAEEAGFRLLTQAEDSGPDLEAELYECHREARLDVPTVSPQAPWSRELFHEWLTMPGKRPDRFWLAREGTRVVGISVLSYPESGVGLVETSWTGTSRSVRGRGLARALKLATLAQAIELGVDRVRTDNDSQNAPILHLNADLGYEPVPGWVKLHLKL